MRSPSASFNSCACPRTCCIRSPMFSVGVSSSRTCASPGGSGVKRFPTRMTSSTALRSSESVTRRERGLSGRKTRFGISSSMSCGAASPIWESSSSSIRRVFAFKRSKIEHASMTFAGTRKSIACSERSRPKYASATAQTSTSHGSIFSRATKSVKNSRQVG